MFEILKTYVLTIVFSLTVFLLHSQANLSWDVLSDVSFEQQQLDDSDAYWLVPTFGDIINLYDRQEIVIEGYLIVIDIQDNFCVLSRYPYTSCFFCGGAGPETIVELSFENQLEEVRMDQRVRIQGRLTLNKMDIEHFNYIISDARIIN